MEHRWNNRTEVEASAVVYHPRCGASHVCIRDAGMGGAFIEGAPPGLPRNAPITLLLHYEPSDRRQLLQLPAMIVRVGWNGLGVMFLEHDPAILRALQRWIDASRTRFVRSHALSAGFPLRAPVVLASSAADDEGVALRA